MTRQLLGLFAACVILSVAPVSAQSSTPFHDLQFRDHEQYFVQCAAGFECDIQLQPGERVNDGFNAHMEDWDPHIGYSGVDKVTPHLVLRPTVPHLRTNIILTTTKRTYFLLAVSTNRVEPSYYTFSYADETFRELNRRSLAMQAALRASRRAAVPIPTATPANVALIGSACVDYDYSYAVDRNLQFDHTHGARRNNDPLPTALIPRVVCTDGSHTFIEFPRQQEVPSDLPISLAVSAEGDTLVNYTYVASLNRFVVDGVYDSFALELGTQDQPFRLRIYHAGRGNPPRSRELVRIVPPTDRNLLDRPIVPIRMPLIATPNGAPNSEITPLAAATPVASK